MKALWNIIRHKYLKVPAIVVMLLIALPVFLFVNQQNQDQRSQADNSISLSFSPTSNQSSPILTKIGNNFQLDVRLNAQEDLVSELKLDISYDPTVVSLSIDNPVIINELVFPEIIDGPTYTEGRIQMTLSVGSDHTKSISSEIRAATLNFTAIENVEFTQVSFGEGSSAKSILNNPDSIDIIPNYSPATIKIELK